MSKALFFAAFFLATNYSHAQEIPALCPKSFNNIFQHTLEKIAPLVNQESPEALQLLANVLLFSFDHAYNQIETAATLNDIVLYANKTKKMYTTTTIDEHRTIDALDALLDRFNKNIANHTYCNNAYNLAMNVIQQPEYKSVYRIVEDLIEQTTIFVHTLTHDQKELLNTLVSNNKQSLEEMVNIFAVLSRTHQALLDGQFPIEAPVDQNEIATVELLHNIMQIIEQQQEKSSTIISNFDSFTRTIQKECLTIFMLYYTTVYVSLRGRNLLNHYGMIMFDEYGIIPHGQRIEKLYDPLPKYPLALTLEDKNSN